MIKFAKQLLEELKNKSYLQNEDDYVEGEEFEKWLRMTRKEQDDYIRTKECETE